MANTSSANVKSAARALDIIELIARYGDGLSFTEIGRELHLPKSSLHSLVSTLVDRGWLVQMPGPMSKYRVGVRAWEAGSGFLRGMKLEDAANESLRSLRDRLDETVQLATLDGVEVVYVARFESSQPMRVVSNVGARLPAYATALGKSILADRSDAEVVELFGDVPFVKLTSRTCGSVGELVAELESVRRNGYALDEREVADEFSCVAVSIRDFTGRAIAAVSCTLAASRMPRRGPARDEFVATMRECAEEISVSLGWRGDRGPLAASS